MLKKENILTLFFFISLLPISIDGIGVNYIFILLPIFFILFTNNFTIPSKLILFSILFYFLLLSTTFFFYSEYNDLEIRRFISFAIFLSIFSYSFINVDLRIISSFKKSLIFISLYLSIYSIMMLYIEGGSAIGLKAKYLIGTNRTGFLYILTIMYLIVEWRKLDYSRITKIFIITTIITGLMLTFSRSSFVAFFITIFSYSIVKTYKWLLKPNFNSFYRSIGYSSLAVLIIALISPYLEIIYRYFDERLISLFFTGDLLANTTQAPISSEGIRFRIWESVLNYIANHPLRGGGFLGVWALPNTPEGSAHSQYIDVLYRTGVIGFILYGIILFKITRFLYKYDSGLLWGFMGILIFGFFNETFKTSQGAAILAILIGFSENKVQLLKGKKLKLI